MRTKEHLDRLNKFITSFENEDSKEAARKVDAVLEPLSVFHQTNEDGEEVITWSGDKDCNFIVEIIDLPKGN